MDKESLKKVAELKSECIEFHEKISYKIDDLCNFGLGFRESSRLSHIADRLDLFIKELKDFGL